MTVKLKTFNWGDVGANHGTYDQRRYSGGVENDAPFLG
jgi:hypothetical protein